MVLEHNGYALIILVQDIIAVAATPCLNIGRQFKLINRSFTKLTYKSVSVIAIDAMMFKEIKCLFTAIRTVDKWRFRVFNPRRHVGNNFVFGVCVLLDKFCVLKRIAAGSASEFTLCRVFSIVVVVQ